MGAYYQIQLRDSTNQTCIIEPQAAKFLEAHFFNDNVMRAVTGLVMTMSNRKNSIKMATVCDYDANAEFAYQYVSTCDDLPQLRKGNYIAWEMGFKNCINNNPFTEKELDFVKKIDALIEAQYEKSYQLTGFIVCPDANSYICLTALDQLQKKLDVLNAKNQLGYLVNPLSMLTRLNINAQGGGDADFEQASMTKSKPYVGSWYNKVIHFTDTEPMDMQDITENLMVIEPTYQLDYPKLQSTYLLVPANDYLERVVNAMDYVEQNYKNPSFLFDLFLDSNIALAKSYMFILGDLLKNKSTVKVNRIDNNQYQTTPLYLFKNGFTVIKNKKDSYGNPFSFIEKDGLSKDGYKFNVWVTWKKETRLSKIDEVRDFFSNLDADFIKSIAVRLDAYNGFLNHTASHFSKEMLGQDNDIYDNLELFTNNSLSLKNIGIELFDADSVADRALTTVSELYCVDKNTLLVKRLYGNNSIVLIEFMNDKKVCIYNKLTDVVTSFNFETDSFLPFLNTLIDTINHNLHRLLLEGVYAHYHAKSCDILYTTSYFSCSKIDAIQAYQVLRVENIDSLSGKMFLREVKCTLNGNKDSKAVGELNNFIGKTLEGFVYVDSFGELKFELIHRKFDFEGMKITNLYQP